MIPKPWRPILALYLPIAIIGLWIASQAYIKSSPNTVRLKVEGFDPRDLLAGHYLIYSVNYGSPIECPDLMAEVSHCLCLDQTSETFNQISQQGSCESITSCQKILRGSCTRQRFSANIERFYFPESHKKLLAVVPPESSIVVSLSSSGTARVKEFFVGHEPLATWINNQIQNQKTTIPE